MKNSERSLRPRASELEHLEIDMKRMLAELTQFRLPSVWHHFIRRKITQYFYCSTFIYLITPLYCLHCQPLHIVLFINFTKLIGMQTIIKWSTPRLKLKVTSCTPSYLLSFLHPEQHLQLPAPHLHSPGPSRCFV